MVSSKFCGSWFDTIQSDISSSANHDVITFSRVQQTLFFSVIRFRVEIASCISGSTAVSSIQSEKAEYKVV